MTDFMQPDPERAGTFANIDIENAKAEFEIQKNIELAKLYYNQLLSAGMIKGFIRDMDDKKEALGFLQELPKLLEQAGENQKARAVFLKKSIDGITNFLSFKRGSFLDKLGQKTKQITVRVQSDIMSQGPDKTIESVIVRKQAADYLAEQARNIAIKLAKDLASLNMENIQLSITDNQLEAKISGEEDRTTLELQYPAPESGSIDRDEEELNYTDWNISKKIGEATYRNPGYANIQIKPSAHKLENDLKITSEKSIIVFLKLFPEIHQKINMLVQDTLKAQHKISNN